jgi:hypothetical protein
MRRFVLLVTVLLGAMLLAGCIYIPAGPGVHGNLDYVITPGGTFIFPEVQVEHRGRVVVPAPGSYRGYR